MISFVPQKAEHKAAAATSNSAQDPNEEATEDYAVGKYGAPKMIQSDNAYAERKFVKVAELSTVAVAEPVWVRGRVHTTRSKGKQCFLVLRQQSNTVQCIIAVNEVVSKQMVKFSGK